jgi:hypothetical protein
MLRNSDLCATYDLSSVLSIFSGAAPLGAETAAKLQKLYPNIAIRQAYGNYPCHIFHPFCSIANRLENEGY